MSFEEKLVVLVSEHEYLYNTKSRTYKNVLKRDTTWAKISEELGKPVDVCKQRWRSLRDRYIKEKKKLNQPSGSGAAEPDVWEYYSSLEFLNEAIQPRKQIGNYDNFNESQLEAAQFSGTDENTPSFAECSTPDPPPRQSSKRGRTVDTPITEFFGDLSKTLSERFKCEEADENDIFMKMIAKKMKVLPQGAKIRLQGNFLKEVNNEILANTKQ